MRTLAALAVVWNHVWNMLAGPMPHDAPWFVHLIYISAGFGQDAVFVFFVISGYWIARSTLVKIREQRWQWGTYAIDRVARLWIVVVPALVIGAILDGIGRYVLDLPLYRAMTVIGPGGFDVGSRLDPVHALTSLFFLQEAVLPPFGSNVPLWSLAYEFWYYVWFPVIALLLIRRRISLLALIAALVTALLLTTYLRAFPIWLFGAGLAVLALRADTDSGDLRRKPGLAIVAGLAAFLAAELAVHALDLGFAVAGLTIGLGFAVFLHALLASGAAWPNWLRNNAIFRGMARYGAGSSFSLYAVHFPVLAMIAALLPRFESTVATLVAALAVSGLLTLWGYLFSRLTEANTGWLRVRMRLVLGLATPTREVRP